MIHTERGRAHLELLSGGVLLHDGLQDAPVCTGLLLGNAAAALQVQGVHLLADVVPQLRLLTSYLLLESRHSRPCIERHLTPQVPPNPEQHLSKHDEAGRF